MTPPPGRTDRGPLGLPLLVLAAVGLAVSGYLVAARFLGEAPVCGPVKGCETVTASGYSTLFAVPIAVFGLVLSVVLVASAAAWWRRGDRRALLLAYGLLLPATFTVACLTYLELFVIHAICAWCVSYAITIVLALATAGLALRRG
jgi:uncharacterized membrane protein